jgi:putative transposase
VLAQVPKGSAEMVAATIRTIFAQSGPAQVREQIGVIAGMLGRQFPRVEAMLHDAAHDITAFPSGTGRGSGPLIPRVAEQGDQAPTDVAGVFPNPETLLRLADAVLVEAQTNGRSANAAPCPKAPWRCSPRPPRPRRR